MDALEGVPGYDKEAFLRVHEEARAPVSIRLNPGKVKSIVPGLSPVMAASLRPVPWSSQGYYLPERPSFTMDPLFHAGVYYVQEASSMFIEQAMRQCLDMARPMRVLDCCAAPGGKSTLIESLLAPGSLLVSNEVIRARAGILEENMVKWGGAGVVVTSNDPRDLGRMENYFDAMVVDAPCSGSGLFRREPEAIAEWSPGNVELCSQRQQRILADVWPALSDNGLMIYSTCSYSREEDESILDWMMDEFDAESCRLTLDPSWGIIETQGSRGGYGYRFFPDKLAGEGLFITVLRKRDGGQFHYPKSKKQLSERLGKTELAKVADWLDTDRECFYFRHNEQIHVLPGELQEDLGYLQATLYLKKAGILMGKLAGSELIPEHELAMCRMIAGSIPSVELSADDAIRYLRKDEIRLDASAARKGWTLARFGGYSLGWVKVLPNRVNNYYPKEWRILKKGP